MFHQYQVLLVTAMQLPPLQLIHTQLLLMVCILSHGNKCRLIKKNRFIVLGYGGYGGYGVSKVVAPAVYGGLGGYGGYGGYGHGLGTLQLFHPLVIE